MTPTILRAIRNARDRRELAVLLTRLPDGEHHLLLQNEVGLQPLPGSAEIEAELGHAAEQAAQAGRSATVSIGGVEWFAHVHTPPLRLILVGAVHVAQALAPMARTCGMEVTVIDPRGGFATEQRFPATTLIGQWPGDAMSALVPDRHTAIVTLSHEARLDDPALDAALRGPAFYVGALGSRKTQLARRERLAALGHDEATLARLHGPVGLAIGAVGPQEIALSIMAEIIAERRGALRGTKRQGALPVTAG